MDEKPKSIWKKPLRLPQLVLVWLGLMMTTMLIFLAVKIIINEPFEISWLMIIGVVSATVLLAGWNFIRWLCCWRNLKRSLFALACFATLIALFYAEENWRGKHDWEKFKREWEAKGERFDWQSIVPAAVPDEQNFAFSPVWIGEDKLNFRYDPKRAEAWYGNLIYNDEVAKIFPLLPVSPSTIVGTNMSRFPQPPENSGTWASGKLWDLKLWQSFYRDVGETNPEAKIIIAPQPQTPAQDVLLALSKFDPVVERLRQDSARPYSRFPIQYDYGIPAAILLPHLATEKRITQILQLRAIAELQNGENEKALADVKLMLRLADASRNEPFLICHLVRIAILQLMLQPIYEGLAEHKWSDAQLAEFDSELLKLDFLADYEFSVRGERALEIANIEFLRHPHDLDFNRPRLYFLAPFFSLVQMLSNLSSGEGGNFQNSQLIALGFGPSGWLYQNELRLAQFNIKWHLPIVDQETKTVSPIKARAADNAIRQEIRHRTPENILATWLMPNSGAEKFAYAQSSVELARTAIALERYRLVHGEFPKSLEALAPQFIAQVPHDVIGGQPLKYRREANGRFILYSVGWNETDDGGVVVFKNGSSPDVDINQGDWVWRYPVR